MEVERFTEYDFPGAKKYRFNPYDGNGGSVVAIAGDDFAMIGADTRLCTGYAIHTRNQSKLFSLSKTTVLASAGCWCDTLALNSILQARMQTYHHLHQKDMSTNAVASMLSFLMYNRRFFPYYVSNILAGIDDKGAGVVCSYDPIGHLEFSKYRAGGSAGTLVQPILDNQIGLKNRELVSDEKLTKDKAISIITDALTSATERDIYTGDSMIIKIITGSGIETKEMPLRRD